MTFDLNPRKDSKTDFMYFEDEPRREDYAGDYSPEDDNLEDMGEEKVEGEDLVGLLLKSMYGTQDASHIWQGDY